MTPPRVAVAAAAAVVLALLVTGCSDDDQEESLSALTPVDRSVQTSPDRDADEVREKAAAVDPCALLRSVHPSGDASPDTSLRADTPHSCRLSDDSVRVDVFTAVSENERHRLARLELAGAVSYRADLRRGRCLVHLPISHRRAISFSGPASCATVTAYAEGAAELLDARPRRASRSPGINRVPACDLVERAGRRPGAATTSTTYSVLDRCDVESSGASLELEYEDQDVHGWQTTRVVDGTTVRMQETTDRCYLAWPVGEPDVTVREGDRLTGFVTSTTCRKGIALAKELVPAARRAESSDRGAADLLYGWDQPDTAATGACADIADQASLECSPAGDAEVPDARVDLIEHAEADPDVLCAAAAPVVREHYGDTFTAATTLTPRGTLIGTDAPDDTTRCAFGSPDHTFEVSIVLSTAHLRLTADDEVAGHPARVHPVEVRGSTATASYAVARDEPGQPGFLVVELTAWPERGTGIPQVSGRSIKPDLTRIEAADPFVADLADALL